MTSPPIVVNGVVVTGSSIADNTRPSPASGEVRGFDARTGQLKWTLDPIPQDPADPAYGEWRGSLRAVKAAALTPGRAWRPMPSAIWRSFRLAAPRRITTARCAPATPLREFAGCTESIYRRVARSFRRSTTTSGTTTTRRRPRWLRSRATDRESPSLRKRTRTACCTCSIDTGRPVFPVEERAVSCEATILPEEAAPTQPFTTGIALAQPTSLQR